LDLCPNNCVWRAEEEGKSGCGEVRYLRGEIWSGELRGGLPRGSGRLTLLDGSFFEGELGPGFEFDGTFTHFTGTRVQGKWHQWRLLQGTFFFEDGDEFEGTWEQSGSVSKIRTGTLTTNENKISFSSQRTLESNNKVFYRNYQSQGFTVVWERFTHENFPTIKSLSLGANGWYCYMKEENNATTRHSRTMHTLLPCERIERLEENGKWSSVMVTPFGFAIRPLSGASCAVTFRLFDQLFFKGQHEVNEFKLKIKGQLFKKGLAGETSLGSLKIKHAVHAEPIVCFNGQSFDSLTHFYQFLSKTHLLSCSTTCEPTAFKSLPEKKIAKKALVEIVQGIKSENQCAIF